jgi:cytochrome P450
MHPETQDRLRAELSVFSGADPTYEDLTSLPYLEAVVTEALRLHPMMEDSSRLVCICIWTSMSSAHINPTNQALEDDVLPLKNPVRTESGALVDKIPIRKGMVLTVPFRYTNMARSIWGEDAVEFKPERWLDGARGVPPSAKEYPGYYHTMTFLEGPRTCLGKGFALLELKVSNLLENA